jgi:hypothetical protein
MTELQGSATSSNDENVGRLFGSVLVTKELAFWRYQKKKKKGYQK